MLQRATAVCTDAYLSPIVHTYVEDFLSGFEVPPRRVEFMSSDGGLRPAQKYTGNAALLSGPAGGVVGVARSCYDFKDPKALIGFDMVWKQLRFFWYLYFRESDMIRAARVRMSVATTENSTISATQPYQTVRYTRQY